jgi:hypothetical protein
MTAVSARSAEIEAQVEANRPAPLAAGMYAEQPVGSVARAWFKRVGVDGWARLDLAQQCTTPLSERRLVSSYRRQAATLGLRVPHADHAHVHESATAPPSRLRRAYRLTSSWATSDG